VLVSLSALDGAILYRIPRDDKYIEEMLGLMRLFYTKYCRKKKKVPPLNFFTELPSHDYVSFYDRTLQIAKSAEVLARIPQEQVQRSSVNDNFFL
jgi:hypothetical protein